MTLVLFVSIKGRRQSSNDVNGVYQGYSLSKRKKSKREGIFERIASYIFSRRDYERIIESQSFLNVKGCVSSHESKF